MERVYCVYVWCVCVRPVVYVYVVCLGVVCMFVCLGGVFGVHVCVIQRLMSDIFLH